MRFASLSTFLLASAFLAACASGGVRPSGDGGRDLGRPADAGDASLDLDKVDLGDLPDLGPPDLGCTSNAECDDHLACDGVETCVMGACTAGAPMACDDGVPCTGDTCIEPGTCQHTPDASRCMSPQLCNATMGCVTPPACTSDAMCDDHLACDGVEHCVASIGCQPGTPPACDDGVACTTDLCMEPAGTCSNTPTDADRDGYPAAGCAGGTDCNDLAAAVHPGAPEVCDGIDNDCDGRADNGPGMTCVQGSAPASCPTSCGSSGTQTCNAACVLGPCVGVEVCNGCDDDGNGLADDTFVCRQSTTSACTTPCSTAGTQTCAADCSGFSRCNAPTEVCGNGCDDNGNGAIDEGCSAMPPPNDQCGGAAVLTGTSGTTGGTLTGATAQTSDCSSGAEVFYQITVGGPSLIYLDTLGSTWDTKISYRGASCPGSSLDCEDDACSTLQTQLTAVVASAGTYFFAVHPYTSTTPGVGAFTLSWQVLPAGGAGSAQLFGTGMYTGSTFGANNAGAGCGGGASGPEYAYYWMQCPGQVRTVGADLCSSPYDTVLHISGPTGEYGCNDDSSDSVCGYLDSRLSASTNGQGLFAMYVDGYGGSSGSYTLNVSSF